jgi:type I restriction enzyme S subunit
LVNNHLEQMAQAIFKAWFVDFEPFADGEFVGSELGEIPAGWHTIRIGDLPVTVTDYVANGSFASLKENVTLLEAPSYAVFVRNVDLKAGNFGKFVDEHSYHFLSKSALFGGEVIISNVGDVGSVFLCPYLPQPMTLGNNMIMLTANERKANNYFFYLLFKHSYGAELIRSITGGSAQPKFNKTDFRSLRIVIPSSEVMNRFLETIECLFQRQADLAQETARIAEIRDSLLPRLMSGELSVLELETAK